MSEFTLYDLLTRSLPYVAAAGDDALAAEIGEALAEHEKNLPIPECEECWYFYNARPGVRSGCKVCDDNHSAFEPVKDPVA